MNYILDENTISGRGVVRGDVTDRDNLIVNGEKMG